VEGATQFLGGVSSGTGSDNNIGMSGGVPPLGLSQQINEVGTAGTGSDNNIGMSEGVPPLGEELPHATQVFGVEAEPAETLTTEGMGVAASYEAIEPENHVIPTYETKVPSNALSHLAALRRCVPRLIELSPQFYRSSSRLL
jgi:hypothetical protein